MNYDAENMRLECERAWREVDAIAKERDALRVEVETLRAALKPFADADLTLPTVRDTFGFDVLRGRAAIAAARSGGDK